MTIEDDDDLLGLQRAGKAVAEARDAMLAAIVAGVSTAELDHIGHEVLKRHGARSAPMLAVNFPAATCISINDEAAHGIPSPTRFLHEGDIVNVDVSAELDGYWADCGASAPVGAVSPVATRLLEATRGAQCDAMDAARAGRPMRHLARAVQRRADKAGFTVIANLWGHGVGGYLHEAPSVPFVDTPRNTTVLWEGLVLAVEPFLSTGGTMAYEGDDGWTLHTDDGSIAAQFEHTMVVTSGKPLVLTASTPAAA